MCTDCPSGGGAHSNRSASSESQGLTHTACPPAGGAHFKRSATKQESRSHTHCLPICRGSPLQEKCQQREPGSHTYCLPIGSPVQGDASSKSQGLMHTARPSAGGAQRAPAGIRSSNWHDQGAAGRDMGGQRRCAGPGWRLSRGLQHQHGLPAAVLADRLQGGCL